MLHFLKRSVCLLKGMANYRNACTNKPLTLWHKDKAYIGATKQVGKLAQNTYEMWKNYDPNEIKIADVEEEDLATLHQKISAGVNITTSDLKNYLYSCTGMFVQTVEINLNVSPNYVIRQGTEISPLSLYKMPNLQFGGTVVNRDKYKELLMNLLFSIRFLKAENPTHQDQLKKTKSKKQNRIGIILHG